MNEQEQKWIETNNQVCALLRQAHDVLALSSLPPKREWQGLTADELNMIGDRMKTWNSHSLTDVYVAIEAKLKEKNT